MTQQSADDRRPLIRVQVLRPDATTPSYAHPGDAGADLCAADDLELAPFERALVPTGLAIALPEGHVGLIHPRSGLSSKHGITVVNAPGTIDAGYRGEIRVPLINLDPDSSYAIRRGDRIAQLVVAPVLHAEFEEAEELSETVRGAGGFGSAGKNG